MTPGSRDDEAMKPTRAFTESQLRREPSMQQICNNPLIVQPVRPMPGRIGVIGAGTIGPDIGYYLKGAIADLELVMIDRSQDALDRALARFRSYADKGV